MSFWWWVLLFGGIAVVAAVIFSILGMSLWRKAKVLMAELTRLSEVTGTLEVALSSLGPGDPEPWSPARTPGGATRRE